MAPLSSTALPPPAGTPVDRVPLSAFFATHPMVGMVMIGAAFACRAPETNAYGSSDGLLRNSQSRAALSAPAVQLKRVLALPPQRSTVAPSARSVEGSAHAPPQNKGLIGEPA